MRLLNRANSNDTNRFSRGEWDRGHGNSTTCIDVETSLLACWTFLTSFFNFAFSLFPVYFAMKICCAIHKLSLSLESCGDGEKGKNWTSNFRYLKSSGVSSCSIYGLKTSNRFAFSIRISSSRFVSDFLWCFRLKEKGNVTWNNVELLWFAQRCHQRWIFVITKRNLWVSEHEFHMYEKKTACLVMIALQLAFLESQNGNVVLITAEKQSTSVPLVILHQNRIPSNFFVITMFTVLELKCRKI